MYDYSLRFFVLKGPTRTVRLYIYTVFFDMAFRLAAISLMILSFSVIALNSVRNYNCYLCVFFLNFDFHFHFHVWLIAIFEIKFSQLNNEIVGDSAFYFFPGTSFNRQDV